MAARRLIIVMVILLGISTAIAIVVPEPKKDDPQEEKSGTTGATGATGETGSTGGDGDDPSAKDPKLVEATVKVNKGGQLPVTVTRPGDHLILTVETPGPVDVSIPELGRTATATRFAPAVFDLILPDQPRPYDIVDLSSDKVLARIVNE